MEAYLQDKLSRFHYFFSNEKYNEAAIVCDEVIADSKQVLANRENNTESENNLRYVAGIMFKGFAEFIQLHNLTKSYNWEKDFKKVESIWNVMCDSTDHLNFSAGAMEAEPLTKVLDRLEKFSKLFTKMFGKGLYASPVIIISKETCSICHQDVRACEHRQGKLYNGVICRHVADTISSMESVDLVQVPKDPRCRLWPWNKKKNGAYDIRILNMTSMDDFLYES